MDTKTLSRKELIQLYHDCKTQAEKDALYWASPELQGIFSAGNHGPKPADEAGAPLAGGTPALPGN